MKSNPEAAETTKLNDKYIFAIAIGLLVIIVLALANVESDSTDNSIEQPSKKEEKPYKISKLRVEHTGHSNYAIVGILTNKSGTKQNYIQISFTLYNDNNVQVGTTMANTSNLAANRKWKFKAPILEDEASKYKLEEVTGF
jgi:hypothetical protein